MDRRIGSFRYSEYKKKWKYIYYYYMLFVKIISVLALSDIYMQRKTIIAAYIT